MHIALSMTTLEEHSLLPAGSQLQAAAWPNS